MDKNEVKVAFELLDLSGPDKVLLVKIPKSDPAYSNEEIQDMMVAIDGVLTDMNKNDIKVLFLPENIKPELISNAAAKKIIKELRKI